MEQDRRNPEEEAGGYGTPTVEQEMGGLVAQDRPEQAIDEAGLEEERGEGGGYPGGAPDLSHLGDEDADSAGEPGAGRMGGTEDQAKAEQDSAEPDVILPSADAPMDAGNTDADPEPDGGASGLPDEKSPRDDEDEGERFDAG
ncbi:hypothetical protein [Arthrobacter celericrescens]|uniref:hypothetical protein n=1 Tax=Arthrobacter celericrescens TaxID=2320851 RepID=UPI000EA047EE|nr:hypothetical protein [Arthrobacter celericrescens]